MKFAKLGAFFFALWGLLHIVGGAAILAELGKGSEFGFAVYQQSTGVHSPLAGAILGMNSFNILWTGLLVLIVAVRFNWRNERLGAWLNIALAGMADVGLVIFLLLPGFVTLAEALAGISLFAFGAVCTLIGRFKP